MDQPLQLVLNKREHKLIEKALQCMVSNFQQCYESTLLNANLMENDGSELLAYYKAQEMEHIKLITDIQVNDS